MRVLKVIGFALGGLLLFFALAIWLFGDRDISPADLRARYANAASRFIELDSGTLAHVRDQGRRDGTPLVLLHGSNASLHTFEPWVAMLQDDFRIITMDLPGHGLTGRTVEDDYAMDAQVAFVDEVTRKLDVERFHLGGNSMGGRVTWHYVLEHPKRVDHMILIDASGQPKEDTQEETAAIGFLLATTPVIQNLLVFVTPRSLIEASLQATFSDSALVDAAMVDRYHAMLLREGSREASLVRFQLPRDDGRVAGLSGLKHPTLILWGEDDRLIPASDAHKFARQLPNSIVRIYEGVGHIPMEEQPKRSAEDIRAFLKGSLRAGG